MAITVSNPSGLGAEVQEGSYTYIQRGFDPSGFFWVRGVIQDINAQELVWIQGLKEQTSGKDPVTFLPSSPTPYEILRYYYEYLHWTDILALCTIQNYVAERAETPKYGYKVGNRFITIAELAEFGRAVRDKKAVENKPYDWNMWIADKIAYEATQQTQTEETKADPSSPYNPDSQWYQPNGELIYTYDAQNGWIIYKLGGIINTKSGLSYQVQGVVNKYDATAQTVSFDGGKVLDLKTMKLTEADKVVTVTASNSLPWYQEIFRKLLTDKTTQLYAIAGLILLIILKRRNADE